jgi:hypothetical protein
MTTKIELTQPVQTSPLSKLLWISPAPGAPPAEIVTVVVLSLMHVISYAMSTPLFIRQILH